VFWVILVYFNIRNTLPKSGTFLLGHPEYAITNPSKRWLRTGNVGVSLCMHENRATTNLLAVLGLINDNINKMLQSGTVINLRLET
jgi:hypothetical protein